MLSRSTPPEDGSSWHQFRIATRALAGRDRATVGRDVAAGRPVPVNPHDEDLTLPTLIRVESQVRTAAEVLPRTASRRPLRVRFVDRRRVRHVALCGAVRVDDEDVAPAVDAPLEREGWNRLFHTEIPWAEGRVIGRPHRRCIRSSIEGQSPLRLVRIDRGHEEVHVDPPVAGRCSTLERDEPRRKVPWRPGRMGIWRRIGGDAPRRLAWLGTPLARRRSGDDIDVPVPISDAVEREAAVVLSPAVRRRRSVGARGTRGRLARGGRQRRLAGRSRPLAASRSARLCSATPAPSRPLHPLLNGVDYAQKRNRHARPTVRKH